MFRKMKATESMKHRNVTKGIFVSRENRFCATVAVEGKNETVHVKNTGRLKELLIPGAEVFLAAADNASRKTKYDLVTVRKGKKLVSIDSQAANTIAEEWLKKSRFFGEDAVIRREVFFKNSRFDFYIEAGKSKIFLEVKGCTLERDGVALFPDAPTERGVKHINELCECALSGYEAYILFVIQMKGVDAFSPNDETHPEFGNALRKAREKGVKLIAVDCNVCPDKATADSFVEIKL